MKTLLRTLTIMLFLSGTQAFAQSERYIAAMKQGLGMLKNSKTPDDHLAAANHFERISKAETGQWMPLYYSSYCYLTAGLFSESKEKQDQYWDKALELAASADALTPDNSEIAALRGYAEFMKMSVDPMSRMALMQKASVSLQKAIELDPENPRPYLIQGQNTFYTPAAFGGGKTAAKPLLEKAVAKFSTFKPENAIAPDWGKERAQALLDQCKE